MSPTTSLFRSLILFIFWGGGSAFTGAARDLGLEESLKSKGRRDSEVKGDKNTKTDGGGSDDSHGASTSSEEGYGSNRQESGEFSSERFSSNSSISIGSMGSDIEEHEDDPFARMEQDKKEEEEEEESAKAAAAAAV